MGKWVEEKAPRKPPVLEQPELEHLQRRFPDSGIVGFRKIPHTFIKDEGSFTITLQLPEDASLEELSFKKALSALKLPQYQCHIAEDPRDNSKITFSDIPELYLPALLFGEKALRKPIPPRSS